MARRGRLPITSRRVGSNLQRDELRRILHGPGVQERLTPVSLSARLKVRSPELDLEAPVDPLGATRVELPRSADAGRCPCENLDSEDVGRVKEAGEEPGVTESLGPRALRDATRESIQRTNGGGAAAAAPSCRYRKITVSHRDAWQNYPASSGGGKKGGPFVSPNPDWVAGNGIMKHRFLLTIDVDGDPNLCRYKQENKNKVVRREGKPGEVVDRDRARHDDTYPRTSSWIRFVGSQIQWMDAPGYPANLDDTDPPVHQTWTFWYSAWDSDGTGPLELELSYDFKSPDAGNTWSITYTPGVPNSVSR